MENGAGVLAEGEHQTLAVRDRVTLDLVDQCRCSDLVTPARGERQLRNVDPTAAGRVDDRIGLLDQRGFAKAVHRLLASLDMASDYEAEDEERDESQEQEPPENPEESR